MITTRAAPPLEGDAYPFRAAAYAPVGGDEVTISRYVADCNADEAFQLNFDQFRYINLVKI